MRIAHTLVIFAIVLLSSLPGYSQKNSPDSTSVVKQMDEFTTAFMNLDWPTFTNFFADDATAFFPPSAKVPTRANNKTQILSIFKNVFDNARKLKPAPPYLAIVPKNLRVQMLGDVAIVTFHLEDPGMFGRRTIVLKNESGRWVIKHLHASGVPL